MVDTSYAAPVVTHITTATQHAYKPRIRPISLMRHVRLGFLAALIAGISVVGCGDGTPPDTTKRAQQWKKSTPEDLFAETLKKAEAGDPEAQYKTYEAYYEGKGVPKDIATAIKWLKTSADNGDALSEYKLGNAYLSGEAGGQKNYSEAKKYLARSFKQGELRAGLQLEWMQIYQLGVKTNNKKIIEYSIDLADKEDSTAQYYVGYAYLGLKDYKSAFKYLSKSAEQGNLDAIGILSILYSTGDGTSKNEAKAFELLRYCASQGHSGCQLLLGEQYQAGRLVAMDYVLAYSWYNLSAPQRPEAEKKRHILDLIMGSTDIAEAQRLSAKWKKGELIVREQLQEHGSTPQPSRPSGLTKQSSGTGFFVSRQGHLMTNDHVVRGCSEIRIQGKNEALSVLRVDPTNDLALLQVVSGNTATSAPITSNPSTLRQGEDIVVFGFPLHTLLSSGGNLTPGVVSALTGISNNTNSLQITAPIQPGSSGSPVLNRDGEVIGIVSSKLSDTKMVRATGSIGQNVNFATNGQTIKTFLDVNKVKYSTSSFSFGKKSTADLADEAKKWTTVVECWK